METLTNKIFLFDKSKGDNITGSITFDLKNHKIIPDTVMPIDSLYSTLKEIWKTDSDMIAYSFPIHLSNRIVGLVNTFNVTINSYWTMDFSYVYGFSLDNTSNNA